MTFTSPENVTYLKTNVFSRWIETGKGYRLKTSLLPDIFFFRTYQQYHALKKKLSASSTVFTFGNPMSTHFVGLLAKKHFPGIQWLAHFSDPWVDNPLQEYTAWNRFLNQHLQNQVFAKADKLIFTSYETKNLAMKPYGEAIQKKAYVLPHCYDSDLYPKAKSKHAPLIIRHLGSFYGKRQPDCLFQAVESLSKSNPQILEGTRFELVGIDPKKYQDKIPQTVKSLFHLLPMVDYLKSLEMMSEADLLILIDAPAEESVFFPSKLADYIGAKKRILGITPEGTAKNILESLDHPTAPPKDIEKIAKELEFCLKELKTGEPHALKKDPYQKEDVYEGLLRILSD